MRDYEEKSYYEIQLDNKQLILVFLAGVTVCVLVFVLGVMVGKGRKEAEIAAASRNTESAAPIRPEPDLEPPQEIQAATPSKKEKNEKKQKQAEEKTEDIYEPAYTSLEDTDSEKPLTKEPSKATKVEAKPREETKVAAKQEPKVEPPKVEPPKVAEKKPEPETPKVVSEEPAVPLSENGRYTVQVMATSSKPKAEAQLASLQSKGYTAFMNEEKAAGNAVFKVRVGKFSDADTARKTAARLKQELQLETWVAVLD
jgi:cell division protein FtsN